jgi:uncharacterized membrane protein YfcA
VLGDLLLGALFAFALATVTAPVGVSGAVFLVPVQVSVLGTPSPAVTPTNLLYNLIAIPGALLRYSRQGRLRGRLLGLLVLGTLPGVVVGAVIRVEWLSGPGAFLLVVAAVLVPLGTWLLLPARFLKHEIPAKGTTERGRGAAARAREPLAPRIGGRGIIAISLAVGVIGGIYGIGGGSILAPVLVGLGFGLAEAAPAALAATFLTSIAGLLTYGLLSLQGHGDIAPDWPLGTALGLGGLGGSYLGAALQPRLPELLLRRILGILALGVGLRYAVLAL